MAYTSGRTVLLSCPSSDVLSPCDDGQVHYGATGSLAAIVRSSGLTMYLKATVVGVPAVVWFVLAALTSSCLLLMRGR